LTQQTTTKPQIVQNHQRTPSNPTNQNGDRDTPHKRSRSKGDEDHWSRRLKRRCRGSKPGPKHHQPPPKKRQLQRREARYGTPDAKRREWRRVKTTTTEARTVVEIPKTGTTTATRERRWCGRERLVHHQYGCQHGEGKRMDLERG
jgi:hypothetical protein